MMSWKLMIDIGHTAVALPLAAAIAVWLVTGRAWKLALCWCLMFAAGLSLVASSKIAFLGWDTGIPSLDFKALSGHALCATAVLPVLFFVTLQETSRSWRTGGVVFGICVSVVLGLLLVHFRFHTASEVLASSLLGFSISLGYIRIARTLPAPGLHRWTVPMSVLAFVLMFGIKPSVVNHKLDDVALYFSGRDHPYKWSEKLVCKVHNPASSVNRWRGDRHLEEAH